MTDLSPTRSVPPAPLLGEPPTTHERLLAAATALFAERGYGGTSMADIAERVGVRKASLYNYYPSKDDLLMELLERSLAAVSACCAPALERPGTVEERLWGYVRGFVGFARENPELLAIFRLAAVQIGGELGERVERVVVALKERQRRRLDEVFADAVAAGEVAPGDPARHAYVFRAFVNGLLLGHLDCHCGERPDDACLREAWELFWHGLAPKRGEA
ncbi:MAG TPA: TetR/AcrR family transcriptional regulator [Thermoanaerobaculia bacterium]|nr:TetR/AcrR family transcriptional regulator [Thermoanaerobaculia bacterium]